VFAVTDIPDLLLSSCRTISNTQMSAASTTHRASLQQRCTFPRRGRSRQFVGSTVGRESHLGVFLKPTARSIVLGCTGRLNFCRISFASSRARMGSPSRPVGFGQMPLLPPGACADCGVPASSAPVQRSRLHRSWPWSDCRSASRPRIPGLHGPPVHSRPTRGAASRT